MLAVIIPELVPGRTYDDHNGKRCVEHDVSEDRVPDFIAGFAHVRILRPEEQASNGTKS